jgi:predicted patatin/cPLA2 family phospholipase
MPSTFFENINLRNEEIKKGKKSDIITGLVLQGGGMRGVYSMAALVPFEELGFRYAFDHIFGSSAGAINGIYFISGQAIDGVTAYTDEISNKKFINPFRLRRIVDIDFLVDEVVKKKKALKSEIAKNAFTTMHIVLTDFLTGMPVEVTNKEKDLDLAEAIRATAAMPILYNKVVKINGRGYIDGGLTEGVPLLRAIELGCTDILVVLTRKPSFRRKAPNLLMRLIESPFLRNYPEPTKKILLNEDVQFNRIMEILENPIKYYTNTRISIVYPSDYNKMVSRTNNNREKLIQCALMARNDTRRFLGLEPLSDNPFDLKATWFH